MTDLQRTPDWHRARLGKLTGSRIDDATARTAKGFYGASRENYMTELLYERRYGIQWPSYCNGAMQWGTEQEPNAIVSYEMTRNVDVVPVGFVDHPRIPMSGASPDGFVGVDGLVEVKCPETKRHFATLLGEPIDGGYIKQMQWQMACTGRQWCDWVSYDPRIPVPAEQIKIIRVMRDDAMIAKLEAEAQEFLQALDAREKALRERYDEAEAA